MTKWPNMHVHIKYRDGQNPPLISQTLHNLSIKCLYIHNSCLYGGITIVILHMYVLYIHICIYTCMLACMAFRLVPDKKMSRDMWKPHYHALKIVSKI